MNNEIPIELHSSLKDLFTSDEDNLWETTVIRRNSMTDAISASIEDSLQKFEGECGVRLSREPQKPLVREIVSATGDDKIIATNCLVAGATQISVPLILGIEISWKDTGFSKKIGNYTEGWVILPPNAYACHTSVMRRSRGSGVPLTFDMVKLKTLSAIRKQTNKDKDLESRFTGLYKSVEWMHPDWIGYDMGQICLLLCIVCLEFKNARTFPYLYKSEGGCGGAPPWNQTETCRSALYFYKNGRAKEGIVQIMRESTLIQEGKLKPVDAVATQWLHFCQTGSRLPELYSVMKSDFYQEKSPEEKQELLRELSGKEDLPEELKIYSRLVEPEDKLTGSVVSELRTEGIVMTELDVRLKILGIKKGKAILGKKPMGEVLAELELEEKRERAVAADAFSKLAKTRELIPGSRDEVSIAESYYEMRKDRSDITGLSYAGAIRVFRTQDVENYFRKTEPLGLEVIQSMESYRDFHQKKKTGFAAAKLQHHVEISSKGIDNLLFLPQPGVGSDDGRILRIMAKDPERVYLVITDDKDMRRAVEFFPKGYWIGVRDYMFSCKPKIPEGEQGLEVFLPVRRQAYLVDEIVSTISSKHGEEGVYVLYDFNNINRNFEKKLSGGFLRKSTAREVNYAEMEWEEFKHLPDFNTGPRTFGNRWLY